METLKSIIGFILGGLFFLGVIIIYASFKGQFHWFIFVTGIALIVVPASIFYIYNWYDSRPKKGEERPRHLSELKITGREINVDLTKCQIKSNSWTVEKERYSNYKVQALNALVDEEKNIERMDVNLARVEYTTTVDGKRRTFRSTPISKDKQTLHFLLEMKQQTSIYIDRDEPRYYYFDLEFLES
jgi:hypothetical protein